MFALLTLFAFSRGELLGADFRLQTPEESSHESVKDLGDDLSAKLLRMRFYIWNKHRPFIPQPKNATEVCDAKEKVARKACDAKEKVARKECRDDKKAARKACIKNEEAARKACFDQERAARKTCIAEGKAEQKAWDGNHTLVIKEGNWSAPWLTYGGEIIDPLQGMKSKIFDPTLKTQFMIHGFSAKQPYGGASLIMQAHQSRGDFDDYNFIGLDWRYLAGFQWANSAGIGHFDSDGYGPASHNVKPAGDRAAKMLLKLLSDSSGNGTSTSYSTLPSFHVIGHSLGCHVAGNMGRTIQSLTGQKLTHITAMEPAGPKFVDGNCENIAIQKSDADYIEAIHTDGALNMPFVERGRLGDLRSNMGDANWYFNGGEKQPGCTMQPFGMLCDHQRSFHFYAASVANPKSFKGFRCALVPSPVLGWLWMDKQGCIEDPPKLSDTSVTAYLTDEYGANKPMGDFAVVTTATYPYTDSKWNSQQ